MGILNLLLNQPIAVQAPAAAPTQPSSPATPASTAAAPAPAPAPQAPPAGPLRPGSSWSFAADYAIGVSSREFDHPTGFSAALLNRVNLGARYQSSPRVSWTPYLSYTNERFDNSDQTASIDTVAAGVRLDVRVTEILSAAVSVELGAAQLSATASTNGGSGLLYGNNFLHYSADNVSFPAGGGNVGASLRLYNGPRARVFLNLDYGARFGAWNLQPDAIDRAATDPSIGISSTAHQGTIGVTVNIGGRQQARLSDPAPTEPTPARPETPAAAPVVTPAATAPAAPAPTPAATPAAPTPANPPGTLVNTTATAGVGNTDHRAPLAFTLAATVPNSRANGAAFARTIRVADVNEEFLANGHTANFGITYTDRNHGSIQLINYSVITAGGRRTTYQAGDPDMPITAAHVRGLMESVVNAGLPRHNATGGHPIHLLVSRGAQGSLQLDSY